MLYLPVSELTPSKDILFITWIFFPIDILKSVLTPEEVDWEGSELEATYATLSSSIYKFWTSDIILLYFKGIIVLSGWAIFLRISYSRFESGTKSVAVKNIFWSAILFTNTLPEEPDLTLLVPLSNISILSPFLRLEEYILLSNIALSAPILLHLNLTDVLYIKEFAKISLYGVLAV